jgi:hypothetical protein
MKYVIEAIVCDPSPVNPEFGGDYVKFVWLSDHPNVDQHLSELERVGWRPLSVKSHPSNDEDSFRVLMGDRQGNQLVVDGKLVHVEDENDV